ncbi:MAG TPA: hypothetical protein VJ999_08400 [Candidatus Sulfotelmatobacter sp.]|nr:hypothetical protein [Candidatus Sulfotelmatobacter sp.]
MRYQDIFVPGGFPRHTYNPRAALQLEEKLSEARDNLCKLVTVTGHTKSGKTVLTKKIFPREDAVWIDGGVVSTEDNFWDIIIEQLDLFQATEKEEGKEIEVKVEGKGSAEANFLVAKGSGEVGAGIGRTRSSGQKFGQTLSSRVVALRGLAHTKIPLIVDDFHYIPRDMQGNIIRALKPLIFDGLPVIIIAIPHRRYDAIKVEREMTGRISAVEIQPWSEDELQFIPRTGFNLLTCAVPQRLSALLATESIGSPHLMQDFCRGLCGLLGFREDVVIKELVVTDEQLQSVFRNVADTIGRPMFEKLARGPRQRSDRLPRQLKDGRTVDIYGLVLHGLAHIRPALVSIEYEELRAAVREISNGQIPQLQEIARVLKHMSTIAARKHGEGSRSISECSGTRRQEKCDPVATNLGFRLRA